MMKDGFVHLYFMIFFSMERDIFTTNNALILWNAIGNVKFTEFFVRLAKLEYIFM